MKINKDNDNDDDDDDGDGVQNENFSVQSNIICFKVNEPKISFFVFFHNKSNLQHSFLFHRKSFHAPRGDFTRDVRPRHIHRGQICFNAFYHGASNRNKGH